MVTARALPVPASTIVGRGAEVEAVSDALVTERLVTLTGPPGVGKTRLAPSGSGPVTRMPRSGRRSAPTPCTRRSATCVASLRAWRSWPRWPSRGGAAATAARLLGAAAVRRDRVAAHPTATEHERVSRASASVVLLLGATEAQREQRAGATLTAAAVRALVDRLGASGASLDSSLALTGRQLEVAALVAAGLTNRQIARELGISEKTAELHLRNAMQRLGALNRAGVAAWVAAQPN